MALEHVCSVKVSEVGLLHRWGAGGRCEIVCLRLNKLYIPQICSALTNTLQEQYFQYSSETFLIQTAPTPKYSNNLKPSEVAKLSWSLCIQTSSHHFEPCCFSSTHFPRAASLLFISPRHENKLTSWRLSNIMGN